VRGRVAVAVLIAAVLMGGCRSGDQPRGEADGGLIFHRADGSTIAFAGTVQAWCGPWNDVIPTRALHVAALGGLRRQPGKWPSYWYLWAVPNDAQAGRRVRFPVDFPAWNKPAGAKLFVGDWPTRNELSTQEEDSSGWISFAQAGCEPGNPVEFSIDAVVGSEFGDAEPVRVEGSFSGVVGEPPPGF
jgi:hypothetical protein